MINGRATSTDDGSAAVAIDWSARHTTKTHVAHVLSKLGLRDRAQAVVFAYEHDLVGG